MHRVGCVRCCKRATQAEQAIDHRPALCFVDSAADQTGKGEAFVTRTMLRAFRVFATALAVAALAGCANEGGYDGDPGAVPLAAGQSCGSIRQELNRLDSRGTQSKVEAASQGRKLPPAAQQDVDRYNQLLNQYLGARCHVG